MVGYYNPVVLSVTCPTMAGSAFGFENQTCSLLSVVLTLDARQTSWQGKAKLSDRCSVLPAGRGSSLCSVARYNAQNIPAGALR